MRLHTLAAATLFALGCTAASPDAAQSTRNYSRRRTQSSHPAEGLQGQERVASLPDAPQSPDAHLTPGATFPVTAADVCVSGYSKAVRNVPMDVKRQAYAEYGITSHPRGEFEVDHLISLELGGSNSIKNLWPESYLTTPWNAHVKDALENKLHQEVCNGKMSLEEAQKEIATDWISAYKQQFGSQTPLPPRSRRGR